MQKKLSIFTAKTNNRITKKWSTYFRVRQINFKLSEELYDKDFLLKKNRGDIFEGAGQGYTIKLPNSAIQSNMSFLCFGELKKDFPKKRLPD